MRTTSLILAEMDRVWGDDGFDGDDAGYAWLLTNYGITEEDDVRWQYILAHQMGDDLPGEIFHENAENKEMMAFVDDEEAVRMFLLELLRKYRSNTSTYTG